MNINKFIILVLMFLPNLCNADIAVIPPDVAVILKIIEQRVKAPISVSADTYAKVAITDKRIYLVNKDTGKQAFISFREDTPGIVKHMMFQQSEDDAYEAVFSLKEPSHFKRVIAQIHNHDAIVYYNNQDVIVYTQEVITDGTLKLNEWIWALRPNCPSGSCYTWEILAGMWQWPLTLDMTGQQVSINRQVPLNGVPYTMKARNQYLLDMMVHHMDEDVYKYFPFKDVIAAINVPHVMTREGLQRDVNVSVQNLSNTDPQHVKPEKKLDFKGWQNKWTSVYMVTIPATKQDYPMLIKDDK